jgi:hypothetical protein
VAAVQSGRGQDPSRDDRRGDLVPGHLGRHSGGGSLPRPDRGRAEWKGVTSGTRLGSYQASAPPANTISYSRVAKNRLNDLWLSNPDDHADVVRHIDGMAFHPDPTKMDKPVKRVRGKIEDEYVKPLEGASAPYHELRFFLPSGPSYRVHYRIQPGTNRRPTNIHIGAANTHNQSYVDLDDHLGRGHHFGSFRAATYHETGEWKEPPYTLPNGHTVSTGYGDAVPGGYNEHLFTTDPKTGERSAVLDVNTATGDPEHLIAWMETTPKYRGQGVMEHLMRHYRDNLMPPGSHLSFGMTTPEGEAWKRKHPEFTRKGSVAPSGDGLVCEACGTEMDVQGLRVVSGHLLCADNCPRNAGDSSFYEDDEPIDGIVAAFENGVKGVTAGAMDYYDVVVLHTGDEVSVVEFGSPDLDRAVAQAKLWNTPNTGVSRVHVINRGNRSVFWSNGVPNPDARFVDTTHAYTEREASRHFIAHDSSDGSTIYHCPFCGSGSVTGTSDGSVTCDFCHTSFTVQVQPQYSAFPQTGPDGMPIPVPGMPGQIDQGGPIDPNAIGDQALPFDQDPDLQEGEGGESGEPDEDPTKNAPPHFTKDSKFRTQFGDTLKLDSYIRHLALIHADDPSIMFEDLRADAVMRRNS